MRIKLLLYSLLLSVFAFAQPVNIVINPVGQSLTINTTAGVTLPIGLVYPERLIFSHLLTGLAQFGEDNTVRTYLQGLKDDGHNVEWGFVEQASPQAMTTLLKFMDSCNNVGLKVIPSNIGSDSPEDFQRMLTLTWNHPALFRYNGKRLYIGWDYGRPDTGGPYSAANGGFPLPAGITRDQFYYWVTARYPEQQGVGGPWYRYYKSYPVDNLGPAVVRQFNVEAPEIDGQINFAVDKPNNLGDINNIILENKLLSLQAKQVGKVAIVSINHAYASSQFVYAGFQNTKRQIDSLLALRPLSSWAVGLSYTTANDWGERTAINRQRTVPVNGLSYYPPTYQNFSLDNNIPYPVLDNHGMELFIRPWIDKWKYTDTTPVVFSTDRIFMSSMLHPLNAAFISTIPPFLADSRPAMIDGAPQADWWNRTIYHGPGGRTSLRGDDLVSEIKVKMPASYEAIEMACHLKAPAYLEIAINGHTYRSGLQNGPDAYYSIPQELGTPVFRIIAANGTTVRLERTSPQAITNSCWPGGWTKLIVELTN